LNARFAKYDNHIDSLGDKCRNPIDVPSAHR
jgi:hypothetical protein